MKGLKGGGKPNQGKGGLASGDREPLFPRLHVNETEKAGPRAPPRNKMALYEQFTVPSHRFVHPTQGSTTTAFHQPYGSGYAHIPYYIPSVPYANANNVQAYAQRSQVTSSSGITSGSMAVNEESRKAPRYHKVDSSLPCKVSRGLTEASAECITNDVTEQRVKFGLSLINNIGESTISLGNIPTEEQPHTSEKTESLHEVVSTLKEGLEGMHQRCDGPSVDGIVDNKMSKCLSGDASSPLDVSETLAKPTKNGVIAKSQTGDSGYKHDSVTQSLTADGHCFMQFGTSLELRGSEESGASLAAEDQNLLYAGGQGPGFALASDKSSRKQLCYSTLQTSLPDVKEVDISEGVDLGNLDIKSFEELKTKDKKHDVSQPARSGGPPDSSADFTRVIKPKNVILAVGQQQFWKARKTLLRQQRIFSDQVFQLHKLIMIQRLLAETPGTLIEEAVHFGTVECDAPAPLAERTIKPGNCTRNAGDSKKGSKSQSVDAEGSPAVSKDVKEEAKVSIPDLIHGGISAWGYPNFGQSIGPDSNQPTAAQGHPYGNQPLAGALPPGSGFNFPYGSGLSGSSPMVSFGIPYCGQRHLGHFSNDFASSWYFMQHNTSNHQRMHSDGSGKDAPTGSGASVNKAPVTAAQGVKTSCFPGLSHHWGINSQAAGPPNMEGLESSGQQCEISSPIATRLACSATPLTPSAPAAKKIGLSHKEVQGIGQNFDMVSVHPSLSYDSRRSVVKEVVDARACSKVQKEGGSSPVDDRLVDAIVHLSDVGGYPVELFPLVPSLTSSEGGRGHVIRAVPRRAIAASESAAGILLSLQREKQK